MFQTVFLDAATLADTDLSPLQLDGTRLQCFTDTKAEQVCQRLQQADIVITNKVCLSQAVLQQLPALKLICVAATGVNNIDVDSARQLGIAVCNVQGYATTAVPQHVMALLLALTNKVALYDQAAKQGRWSQSPHFCLLDYPVTELAGKTFVVVGYGALGQATARLAAAFGMTVLVAEQPAARVCRPGRVPFHTALAQADVISLHCPLTPDTAGLINADVLSGIKTGALLINTARGGLIDEIALLHALQNGKLAGAALDVLSTEPPAADHPLLTSTLDNLLITPHMAWATAEARRRMVTQLASHIRNFIDGKPLPSL